MSARIEIIFSSIYLRKTSEFVGTALLCVFNILNSNVKFCCCLHKHVILFAEFSNTNNIWRHPNTRWRRTWNTSVFTDKILIEFATIIVKCTFLDKGFFSYLFCISFLGRVAELSYWKKKFQTFPYRTDSDPFLVLIRLITFPSTLRSFLLSVLVLIAASRKVQYFFKIFLFSRVRMLSFLFFFFFPASCISLEIVFHK